jgi:Mg2+-importing ATPase
VSQLRLSRESDLCTYDDQVGDSMDFSARLQHDRKRSSEDILMAMSSMTPEAALGYLQSDYGGLSEEEIAKRLSLAGHNVLSTNKPPTWWQLLLRVLPNAFNFLLILLATISVATPSPQWSTFAILMVMIAISVVVRFWQEYKSNVATIKLQESVSSTVSVRRQIEGKASDLTDEEKNLVPGDIVLLSPGDIVPGDCLVLESGNLQVSQSR